MNEETTQEEPSIIDAIASSLRAKVERELERSIIARLVPRESPKPPEASPLPLALLQILGATRSDPGPQVAPRDPRSGGIWLDISLDYMETWRGAERELEQSFEGALEERVHFLTDEELRLLEREPAEFLETTRPAEARMVDFRQRQVGAQSRVVAVCVDELPAATGLRHLVLLPNLVPLRRQLLALRRLQAAEPEGPLAALRSLVGLSARLPAEVGVELELEGRLDPFQRVALQKASQTPSFALLQGPPGSGKSTVIAELVRGSVRRGERVLVVSPTNVAVDNVVEKLSQTGHAERLELASLPVRYASKPSKLLPAAAQYWEGAEDSKRVETISGRLRAQLQSSERWARAYSTESQGQRGQVGPLTRAICDLRPVLCGTPIGVLSCDDLKRSLPASFDLLVVDEVSKLTLPEFLAVAVKAKRWVLVGDPEQLPPYNDAEANSITLDDLVPSQLELVCSLASVVQRGGRQGAPRVAVVCEAPSEIYEATRAHFRQHQLEEGWLSMPSQCRRTGLVCCTPEELPQVTEQLSVRRERDPGARWREDEVQLIVQRGLRLPVVADGLRRIPARLLTPARLFETAFTALHLAPWCERAAQDVLSVRHAAEMEAWLPSQAALSFLNLGLDREALMDEIALRFAVNTWSVYDWLRPPLDLDLPVLRRLASVTSHLHELRESVRRWSAVLELQYRMHSSLSLVPRELFYFGEALKDGRKTDASQRVSLLQVEDPDASEVNRAEANRIREVLAELQQGDTSVMVITPYKRQERLLQEMLSGLRVEVCTLDRCQGREADYVFLSLVRPRATLFLDAPKRWNVALTRAREGLIIVGNIRAYQAEARRARTKAWGRPVRMSVLARIIESYATDVEVRR